MTPKQKKKAVDLAVKKMREAADAMLDLEMICIELGVESHQEEAFRDGLRERACYWENCTWWKR